MRLLIMSDLHLDFHEDDGRAFLRALDPYAADALVLAGDVCLRGMLPWVMSELCDRFAQVVYVTGNHEYYGCSPREVHDVLELLEAELSGFHWLHESEVVIEGVRFGGTTLWFPDDPGNAEHAWQLMDFKIIREFVPWVYEANRQAVDFLRRRAAGLDVVLTHYLPAVGSVDPMFAGSPLNRFFLCDVEDLVKVARPALWVHGHTHASCDTGSGPPGSSAIPWATAARTSGSTPDCWSMCCRDVPFRYRCTKRHESCR